MNLTLRSQHALAIGAALLFVITMSSFLLPARAHAATLTIVAATTTSNNASTTLAKVGNTVSYGLQLSGTPAATSTPTINILGMGTTSFTGSGAFWTYSTTTSSSWSNGFIPFLLAWGGSVGESTTTATQSALTGPNVNFNKTAPTISSITSSAVCTQGSGTLCVAGNTIAFTLTPSATVFGGSVAGSYNGVSLTWSTGNGGVTYTATYTVSASDTNQNSPLQISGVVLTDAFGNASTAGAGSDITVKVSTGGGGLPAPARTTLRCPDGTSHMFIGAFNASTVCSSQASTAAITVNTSSVAPTKTTPSVSAGLPPVLPAVSVTYARNLKVGSSGADVNALQLFLIAQNKGSAAKALKAHGTSNYFGSLTKAALVEYQKAQGISTATGYFGAETRAKMGV